MTCGISWRTSWTRTRRCSFDMDASIPKFRNESLSKIDVVSHRLCTNPHNEHKAHNDSAQNCQFPWGSVTHMSGAPSERQKLSGGVLPRDGSVKCLVPRQTASLLGTMPSLAAPPERHKMSGSVLTRSSGVDCFAPGETASPLGRVPSCCTTRRAARTDPTGTTAAMAGAGGVKKHHLATDGVTQTAPPSLE